MDQASKDIFDDELLVMAGDESDDEDEELDGPIFGVAAITSPPTADSTILKTDLTFVAEGFSGFAAGAKPFAASSLHIDAATMTKAASNEPALVLAPGVKRSHKVLDDTEAEHSLAKKTKLIQTFIAARIITKKPTSAMRKRKETVRQATVIRTLQRHNKLSACLDSLKESFHAPQVSSSLVVQPFLTMADEAEIVTKVAVKIDFLSTNRAIKAPKSTHAPKTKVFAAGGFSVTAKDTSSELTSLPVDRKRSCFHNGALVKKAKFNHDTIEELQLDAPPVTLPVKALTFDFLPIGRPIKTLKGASADGKAKVFAAGNFSVSTKDISALEPLTVNRKRSFSEDGTLVKKAKLAHDANEEPKLDAAPVTLLVKVLTFDLVSLERPIKALKVTRTAPMSKVFVAGKLSVPNKDTSKVEPLSANRKRACPNDGDAPVKKTKLTHESEAVSSPITPTVKALTFDFVFEAGGLVQNKVKPLSLSQKRSRDDDVEASVKKVKLSAETSELVHSLVAGLKPYLGGSLASRGSTRAYTAKGNGKYAAKTGFWRNALLEKTTMV
jgi:hypothetical protein